MPGTRKSARSLSRSGSPASPPKAQCGAGGVRRPLGLLGGNSQVPFGARPGFPGRENVRPESPPISAVSEGAAAGVPEGARPATPAGEPIGAPQETPPRGPGMPNGATCQKQSTRQRFEAENEFKFNSFMVALNSGEFVGKGDFHEVHRFGPAGVIKLPSEKAFRFTVGKYQGAVQFQMEHLPLLIEFLERNRENADFSDLVIPKVEYLERTNGLHHLSLQLVPYIEGTHPVPGDSCLARFQQLVDAYNAQADQPLKIDIKADNIIVVVDPSGQRRYVLIDPGLLEFKLLGEHPEPRRAAGAAGCPAEGADGAGCIPSAASSAAAGPAGSVGPSGSRPGSSASSFLRVASTERRSPSPQSSIPRVSSQSSPPSSPRRLFAAP